MKCARVNECSLGSSAGKKPKVDVENDNIAGVAVDDIHCESDCESFSGDYTDTSSSDNCDTNDVLNVRTEDISAQLENESNSISDYNDVTDSDDSSIVEVYYDTDCDQSDSVNHEFEYESELSLRDEVAEWARKHNVPRVVVSDLLKILSKYHPSLPKDSRTLLKTTSQPILPMQDMLHHPGEYVNFGIEKQLCKNLTKTVSECNMGHLELFFNIDGLPLFRSSLKQFWPILCAARIDGVISKPFVIAIFCGSTKLVSADVFLSDFVTELAHLQQTGVCFGDTTVQIMVKGIICDAPARAFIKCIKGHGGYYGCEKCEDRGTQVNKRMTFQNLDARL